MTRGAVSAPECICVFEQGCAGLGLRHCRGCGGDQCICAACFGDGVIDCPGCEYCGDPDLPEDSFE